MGKVLRPEHLNFFTSRMNEHSRVTTWELIDDENEYLFRITRTVSGTTSDVIVHLTDAYRYGLAEFYTRPKQLRAGSYVVIGMPHADTTPDVVDEMKRKRIGIGHIGKFMGALNYRNIWEYMTPDERRQEEETQQRRVSETSGHLRSTGA